MSGYTDTKKLIEDTLMGRPVGSLIYPEGHQAMAMSLLDYIHSVELLGASELQGIADTSTVPVQPNNAKVSYIATVPAGQTYVFTNFHDQNGNSISITTGANTISLLTFLWNGEYWQVQNNQVQFMLNIAEGYLYAGIAIPTTNPGSPDEPVFYIAAQAGTYANFGGIVVNDGEAAILKYVNSSWVKEVSGLATRKELSQLGQEIDITAFHSIFSSENIEIGKYIKDDGIIDVAIDDYRLAKFEIKSESSFYATGMQLYDRPFLVKYTDSTFTTPESIIIQEPNINEYIHISKIVKLSPGFYAVAWKTSHGGVAICDVNAILKENRSVFNTALSANDNILVSRYIASDGAISAAIDSYQLVKLEITEPGKYFLSNIGNPQHILAKYTDKECTIFEKFVVGISDDYSGIIELESGYYALSWNVNYFANNPTFFNVDDIIGVINLTIPRSIIYDIACENIEAQYITDAGGIEPANENYRLGKFEITEAGKYYLGESIYVDSHPTLAKFADSSYSGNGQILIGASSTPIDGSYYLEPGFYALCGSNYQTIVVTYISGIEKYLDGLYQKKHNFGGGITDFSDLIQNTPGAWSIVSKDKIESVSTGYANRIYFPIATYEDYFLMSVVVTPKTTNNGNWEFVFGRDSSGGTLVHIGQDANGKFAAIYCADTLYQRYDLSALRMGVGRALSIVLEKSLDTLNFFNLTITDEAGNVFTQERIVSFDQSTGNFAAGLGYGPLTMYGITGAVALEKLSFVYPKDANDIKLAICGHSFVAGHNSTIYNQDKKFASLLATDVGLKNTCVFGLGGGDINMIPALSLQLGWISSVRYVIIMLGANDNDNSATAYAFQSFYDSIKAMGAFPIWLTIPKLKDGTQAKPYLAQYIKDHFFYVDVDQIFVDENGNIVPSMYGDIIHPSIEGYRRMYEVIKNQCSFIFGV